MGCHLLALSPAHVHVFVPMLKNIPVFGSFLFSKEITNSEGVTLKQCQVIFAVDENGWNVITLKCDGCEAEGAKLQDSWAS